jgi:hypothetical protein
VLRCAALLWLLAAATWVAAQYRANNRVNTGLYGAGTLSTGSVRAAPYQTSALPSQTRNAYWQSGMSRSEVRANYSSMGPMASGGAISYVTPSRSREAVRGPLDVAPPSQGGTRRPSLPPAGSAVVTTPGRSGGTPALGSVTYSSGGSSRAAAPNAALGGSSGLSGGGAVSWGGSTPAAGGGGSQVSSSLAAKSSTYDPSDDGRFDKMISRINPTDVALSGSIRFSDSVH